LVDVEQVRQWQAAQSGKRVVLEIAAQVPEVLAQAAEQSHQQIRGDKALAAEWLAIAWYVNTNMLLEHLRSIEPTVPPLMKPWPPAIERLLKIAR
jgi:hypothetical protein